MDPGSSPQWILPAHPADQIANVFRHTGPTGLAPADFPRPKQAKALPVPADHGGWLNEEETGAPILPHRTQPSPEEAIRRSEFGPLHRALQNADLMAQRQNFQLQGRAAPERSGKRVEDRREEGAEGEPKEERQTPSYQLHRYLREPQSTIN